MTTTEGIRVRWLGWADVEIEGHAALAADVAVHEPVDDGGSPLETPGGRSGRSGADEHRTGPGARAGLEHRSHWSARAHCGACRRRDTGASRPWFPDMSDAQTPAQAARWPVELALAPHFHPGFYGELIQFAQVLPWTTRAATTPASEPASPTQR